MTEPRPILTATCPRCGYDLRGVLGSWRDFCPLFGRCAECGLNLYWGDLLHPSVRGPNWCIEYYQLRAQIPRRLFATMFMTLRPRRFWTDLAMHHRFRPARIFGYLAAILGLWLATCCGSCLPAAFTRGYSGKSADTSPLIALAFLIEILIPCAFVTLPISLRQAKVLPSHLARITLYGLTTMWGFVVVLLIFGVLTILNRVTGFYGVLASPVGSKLTVGYLVVLLPVLWWWWTNAIGRHLKIPHAPGVAAAIVSIATLVPLTILSVAACFNLNLALWVESIIDELF